MAEYGTIWTRTGRNKEANNLAGGPRITLTHLAVGDGNGAAYEPSDAMTALAREVWRGGITRLEVDPNNPAYVIVEAIIPTNIGGWTVREAGLFDDAGELIVIARMPETYKPQLAEGAGKELLVRIIIEKTSAESTPIRIDPAIATASRAFVDAEILKTKSYADAALQVHADSYQGFALDGEHEAYTGALDAIGRNSLYAVQQGVATNLPEDLPSQAWAFVQTMILPGDAGRTQLVWSVDDPEHAGWWRRRAAGTWSDWRPVGSGVGLPVGSVIWVPGTTPPPGMLAVNTGAEIGRATWPELWAFAQNSGLLLTEAEWQAQAAAQSSVGYFSSGDGSTTFRLPRLRDYLRAADPVSGRGVGAWQEDDVKSHQHLDARACSQSDAVANAVQHWGYTATAPTGAGGQGIGYQTVTPANPSYYPLTSPVGGSETRPKSINWLPCIQAASAPVNAGTVDMLELASEVASLGRTRGLPVGTVLWVPGTTPPPGMLALSDGASVNRGSWPELWAFAQSSGLLITETEWQAQAAAQSSVGYFSEGDGSTTFRLPKLRDFVRGADPSHGRAVGAWQADELASHAHRMRTNDGLGHAAGPAQEHGFNVTLPFRVESGIEATGGTETRPKSINWLPCIQAASVAVNTDTVDMLALASEVARKADRAEVVLQKIYNSGQQAISIGGSLSLAHGLEESPKEVVLRLECLTAEGGYTVGDMVYLPLGPEDDGAGNFGVGIKCDATYIRVQYPNGGVRVVTWGVGSRTTITPSYWRLHVRVFA